MLTERPLIQMLLASAVLGLALWLGVKWFLSDTHEFSSSLDASIHGYTEPEENQESASSADNSGSGGGSQSMGIVTGDQLTIADVERHESVLKEQQYTFEEPAYENDSEQSGYLSEEELEARAEARRERLADLGLIQETPLESTTAVDVSLLMPENCKGAVTAKVPIGLKYRNGSPILRGESLNALESMVALYRLCEQGNFAVVENPLDFEDATRTLTQMRFDEVKYFFIQHRISMDVVQFPEKQ